ncbi:hypothetical protein CEUSTIGMA_g2343.t1 [Chlamydomonas eustigma]|uniref:Integrase catalytic domain-containing protein n=1 Tax=Chlamydomonas eustigma TaxID=1157962 RepID=A0A250WVN9_9CHLO|nr:hypothetical protein CEUSTIGMA_g2343.t1 [Chlamydomonas eustigma]|eukprot:GAX74897.1 hypothetical protein CEUSTIGMA_g2343.t1 [Chlamydomonas eustigma]
MTRTVKSYVSSCATCQRIKPSTQLPPGLLQPHAVPVRPSSHVSMDLITDLPKSQCHDTLSYDSIVTFVDMLTKQAIFVRANKSITSQQLAHVFIDHVFSKHGLPSVIISDRDPRITSEYSEFWQTLFTQLGSKLNLSTAHHPQTDGQTEITHRTIEQILRAYVSPQHNDWATWLPLAEFAYNSHVHSSTQQTPFLANYGFHPTTPSSLLLPPDTTNPDATSFLDNLKDVQNSIRHQLDLAKARQETQANRSRRPLTFTVGDRVRLSSNHLTLVEYPSSKLRPRFLGPFTINKFFMSHVSYVSYPGMTTLHLNSLNVTHPVIPWLTLVTMYAMLILFTAFWIAEFKQTPTAVRARPKSKCLFFKVRWSTPNPDQRIDTWEPMRSLTKLTAFKDFLSSPTTWSTFVQTPAYLCFARLYKTNKTKIPKVVHFAVLDDPP